MLVGSDTISCSELGDPGVPDRTDRTGTASWAGPQSWPRPGESSEPVGDCPSGDELKGSFA